MMKRETKKQELSMSKYPTQSLPFDSYNPSLIMGDKVRMINLSGDHLEGKTGTLVGISIANVIIHWIVELDEPTTVPFGIALKCVSMPSVCLERIE